MGAWVAQTCVGFRMSARRAVWEDFYDGLVSEQRRKEKGVPLDTVKADLIKRGRLRG